MFLPLLMKGMKPEPLCIARKTTLQILFHLRYNAYALAGVYMEDTSRETRIFASDPVHQAVFELALPTIITQLINIVYNLADTWYVGRTGNPAMVAALSVCMPVYIIMAAVANLFGIGGSSAISRSLGQKKPERARHVFAFCLWSGLAAGALYGILMAVFRDAIIPVIGGDVNSTPYIRSYMFWTMMIGAIPTVGNVLCGHLVRSIGCARQAGFGMSMGGILNIVLDPLFMFVLLPEGNEVAGAAIATLISNSCALIYFLIFLSKRKNDPVLTLNIRDVSTGDGIPGDVLMIGLPAALQTTMAMVSNIFANALVKEYGSAAVAGMGVAKKINTLSFNTNMGLTQGVLPLVGYCYGAKNWKRMKQTISFTMACAVSFGVLCTILFRVFAPQLVTFFIDEAASVAYGMQFLRIIAFACATTAFSYLSTTVFQACGRRRASFVLSILRKGIFDIPAMFVFRHFLGAQGVVWATPFAEVLALIIALIMFFRFMSHLEEA